MAELPFTVRVLVPLMNATFECAACLTPTQLPKMKLWRPIGPPDKLIDLLSATIVIVLDPAVPKSKALVNEPERPVPPNGA